MRYILHFDEICLKGANRSFFEKALLSHVKESLNRLGKNRVRMLRSRLNVEILEDVPSSKVDEALAKIPGLCDFSQVVAADSNFDSITAAALEIFTDLKGTFRVVASRSDKRFKMTSPELARELGARIIEKYSLPVDLHNPQHRLYVKVCEEETYLYSKKIPGMGGLPIGSSGRVLSFLSGGIDSPVSSYLMFRRGCRVSYVHFHNHQESGPEVREKVESLASTLSQYQPYAHLYLVPLGDLQRAIIGIIPSRIRMIVYRRLMFRLGSILAKIDGSKAFITGDAVGQVASQTLDNIRAIQAAADLPVLSPLVGSNKNEIIKIAREINTYELSIQPYDDCCTFLVDPHPETAANLAEIEESEEPLPLKNLLTPCIEKTTVIGFSFGEKVHERGGHLKVPQQFWNSESTSEQEPEKG